MTMIQIKSKILNKEANLRGLLVQKLRRQIFVLKK